DSQCTIHLDCRPSMACINGKCSDPCGQPGACGVNASCNVVNHEASCSCLECHFGAPAVACQLNTTCIRSPPEPPTPTYCISHQDCNDKESCNENLNICYDPCDDQSACEPNKRCEVRKHQKNCICKFGFTLNSAGEFVCAGSNIEC
ncbi:hypothetical protein FHG87_012641, partial [Trinorchestia longiramus]